MDSILLVLARVPRPGFVKTRLAARIGEGGAIAVYEAMLIDLLARYAPVSNLAVSLVHPHDDVEETLRELLKHHGLPQERFSFIRGIGALDRDIAHSVSRSLITYPRVALTAVDMPQYGPDRLSELFRALDEADVAFHPNEDDGCHPCAMRVWCDLWTGNDSRIPAISSAGRVVRGKLD